MKISDEVLSVLSAVEYDASGNVVIAQQLDRALYTKTNQVLEALGGKWQRKLKAHSFSCDARERIELALTTGEVTTHQELGFFRTPDPIARQLVEAADVRPGHIVLEPSAGDGAIVRVLLEIECGVVAIERDRQRKLGLMDLSRRMLTLTVLSQKTEDDFLEYVPDEPFDRVVMNPPFCKVGLGDHLDHVRHAFSMLVPGGVLVSVLPAGVQFRRDRRHREFREWALRANDDENSIENLPDDAFKPSGTSVRTCMLRMVKR
jgi:protein-L-isoaspartate O-methyltransferase